MKEKVGEVFRLAECNEPVPGCTVSKEICGGENSITVFSMAEDTDISAEIYPYYKLLLVIEGSVCVYGAGEDGTNLAASESILTKPDVPVGLKTATGVVYTEVTIRRDDIMNKALKAGDVFRLAELVPYQEGKIVNMDVVHNDEMKFVVMAFDAGTGLAEHAAPGEALIFALDGEAVIGYEGKEHSIKAGDNFHFAKGGLHSVKTEKRFKMALLLTQE